ncbi:type II toxin-antitoxin system HipA family toxin [Marinospirillum insulare]|uniref:Phosphatidylinositol kinase n=1 Tax=Marinospirillum insulare TaxID=217169 RepID=A0ABQ5ZU95_9GAMM|nr:type II toxin-antitoxin system HipA family toxin [Marinospirillum insulare]GLR63741.1 phosphatidylinositol kinase [Marinospirillum insulare]
MSRQPTSKVYIFAQTLAGEYVPAAVLSSANGSYSFGYAKSWMARGDAFALDPINLPFTDSIYRDNFLWSCFDDTMPDNWGRRVILSIHKDHPKNHLEWMLASRGSGVGMLAASASQHYTPKLARVAEFGQLEQLMRATRAIELGDFDSQLFSPELLKVLQYGSSMGGARPKVTVSHENKEWIAKFSRNDDIFNQVKAEKACLEMARSAGCRVPEVKLIDLAGSTTIMVERFDRLPNGQRLHYLSANAILNIHKTRPNDQRMGYPHLAGLTQRLSFEPELDQKELFTRMLLNIMVGNTDDHLKNHGFLREQNGLYRLSPIFDVLPHPSQLDQQAILVGENGREASLTNAMSKVQAFGLTEKEALLIIQSCADVVDNCQVYFSEAGMNNNDIARLSNICLRTLGEAENLISGRVNFAEAYPNLPEC